MSIITEAYDPSDRLRAFTGARAATSQLRREELHGSARRPT